jgi:hypothetical protein
MGSIIQERRAGKERQRKQCLEQKATHVFTSLKAKHVAAYGLLTFSYPLSSKFQVFLAARTTGEK